MLQMKVIYSLISLCTVALVSSLPVKDSNGHEIDLNNSPIQSSSEELGAQVDHFLNHSAGQSSPGDQDFSLASRVPYNGIRRRRQQHASRFLHHREVALRLRERAPSTLSKEEKRELSKTRKYLGLAIAYYERHRHDQDRLNELKDLYGHLQGGHWNRYIAPMGVDELRRKKGADKAFRLRTRLKLKAQQGYPSTSQAHETGRD